MKGKGLLRSLIVTLALLLTVNLPVTAVEIDDELLSLGIEIPEGLGQEEELDPGSFYTIISEEGQVLDKTSRRVWAGDEFIAQDNQRYRVKRVDGTIARAQVVGAEDVVFKPIMAVPVQGGNQVKNLVGMYNTHSDESYVPTDGSESIPGEGGIYKVGEVLAEKLESLGVKVEYDKRSHEPHDSNAYKRSRRTAYQLMQDMPAAIIDVHRDGVPDPDFYNADIAGQPVTRVRLVVGRQNQNMDANLEFAKSIKAYLDEKYPGLVQGIFLAKGNYNQDLSPRSILVEVGTYTNDRARAQRGVALFAEAIGPVTGMSVADAAQRGPQAGGTDWSSVFWIILLVVAGIIGYLWIATGSWKGVQDRLKKFASREWFGGGSSPSKKVFGELKEPGKTAGQNAEDRRDEFRKD